MNDMGSFLAVFETCRAVEAAVKSLRRSGLNSKEISVLGTEHYDNEGVIAYYSVGCKMRYWGQGRAFWGSLWQSLSGAGFFLVPGVGPILIAGPAVTWVSCVIESALLVPGLSVVGAGLCNRGVPREFALLCESALKTDKLVIVAHGTAKEVMRAKDTVRSTRPVQIDVCVAEAAALYAA
jgi:hypothetical protein